MADPRLVYDHDCGFCQWCVRWMLRFGSFTPVSYEELTPDQKARLPDEYDNCMHLLTDDAVYSCGEALEQVALRCGFVLRTVFGLLSHLPRWERIRERGYRFVADRRALWGRYRACDVVE